MLRRNKYSYILNVFCVCRTCIRGSINLRRSLICFMATRTVVTSPISLTTTNPIFSLYQPRARDGSVRSLFPQITHFRSALAYEMENLTLDGPPPQGGLEAGVPPLGPGVSPGPNQQLPPQMFTTAAQLLDMTDSKPSMISVWPFQK